MAAFKVHQGDLQKLLRNLTRLSNDVQFMRAYALTKTGQDIKEAELANMRDVFDRPTPFALNALQLSPATKTNLQAIVGFKAFAPKGTPGEKFLKAQVEGGPRAKKRHEKALERAGILRSSEYVVPSSAAPLDAYGNIKGSLITRILSDISANPDPLSNSTAKTRTRRWKRGGGQYFVMRGRGAADGIYFRLGLRDIRPILLFVKAPTYVKRFDFYGIAARTFAARYEMRFREGYERYVLAKL